MYNSKEEEDAHNDLQTPSSDQMALYEHYFNYFDVDKDGKITTRELAR